MYHHKIEVITPRDTSYVMLRQLEQLRQLIRKVHKIMLPTGKPTEYISYRVIIIKHIYNISHISTQHIYPQSSYKLYHIAIDTNLAPSDKKHYLISIAQKVRRTELQF